MMAKKVSMKGRASFKKLLEMVSFPKLLVVLSLAIVPRMCKALMCLKLNRVLFLLTTLLPARRRLGASSILLARFSPIEAEVFVH